MTENAICRSYRGARNPVTQMQVLADLNGMDKMDIMEILVRNGESLPETTVNYLHKRMDTLKKKIAKKEEEYRANVGDDNYNRYKRLDRLDREIARHEREYREIENVLNLGGL